MSRRQRAAIFAVVGGLWLTGCAWLVLDQWFSRTGAFGPAPHPWQPPMLLAHGLASIGATFLFGWIADRHVLRWWSLHRRRWSGSMLAAFLTVLGITGFALFFLTDDRWQRAAALAHDALGVAVTVFAVQHWFFASRRDMRSAASRP